MADSTILVIFSKPPIPGEVKTRLTPPLTAEQAAAVHDASLRDVVNGALSTELQVQIRYGGGPSAGAYFDREFPELRAEPQCDGDLGLRMAETFEALFRRGAGHVIIIGSDSPTLPTAELKAAQRAVRSGSVVFGPAADGGYYLVGLRSDAWPAAAAMFGRIPWSTAEVLNATLRRLTITGLPVEQLSMWYDIDRVEDLRLAAADAAPESQLGTLLRSAEFAGVIEAVERQVVT